jgi:adenosylcobinamide-phosphate synthase
MIRALWSLPLAAVLDAALGDPRGWPHPVRWIGGLIALAERALRRILRACATRARIACTSASLATSSNTAPTRLAERFAGVALVVIVVSATLLVAAAFVLACDRLGPIASLLGRSLLIYWALAARSLGHETLLAALAPDLETARRALAMIVGRDTGSLDEVEIHRACLETIGENANDGVVAPLFWFALGGPVALWGYKAINTLDSMVGYRNERYEDLGWAAAKLDDLANLVPARLTWLLFAVAAAVLKERAWNAVRVGWRDGRKHPSPNAAWGEAALAGALAVQLGGALSYGGVTSQKPLLGEPTTAINPSAVRRAVRLMWVVAALAALLAWGLRAGVLGLA